MKSKLYRNLAGPIGMMLGILFLWPVLWILSGVSLVERIEVILFLVLFYEIFPSTWWATFSKQGPWNIVPTIVICISILFVGLPVMVLGGGIHLVSPKKYTYRIADVSFRIFAYLVGFKCKQLNEIPIDSHETVICTPNHSSWIDSVLAVIAMNGRPWSVAAAWKMFFTPPFCFFLWRHSIPLRKNNIEALGKFETFILECVDQGISPLLFIEGTRPLHTTLDEPMGDIKNGAFKYARKKNKRILPIVFIWPKLFKDKTSKNWWLNPQPIYFYFCDPIVPDNNAKKTGDGVKSTMVSILKKYMPVWAQ